MATRRYKKTKRTSKKRLKTSSAPVVLYSSIQSADMLRKLYENKKKDLRKKLGEKKASTLNWTGVEIMSPIVLDEVDKIYILQFQMKSVLLALQNSLTAMLKKQPLKLEIKTVNLYSIKILKICRCYILMKSVMQLSYIFSFCLQNKLNFTFCL